MRERISVSPQQQSNGGMRGGPVFGLGDDESDPEESRAAVFDEESMKQGEVLREEGDEAPDAAV